MGCPEEGSVLQEHADINWFERKTDREYRQRLIPSQRIDLIYAFVVHNKSMKSISEQFGIEKSTVSKVIKGFREQGRMFKLLPSHSKNFILNGRI